MESHKLQPKDVMPFILGGRALFTIKNLKNGNRFTYKVEIPHDKKPESTSIYFVKLLTGSDNENSYRYIGFIRQHEGQWLFIYGRNKAKMSDKAPGVIAFTFVFNQIVVPGRSCEILEIWHEGKCCRCGRTLTVPESLIAGVGPECLRIISAHKHEQETSFA